MILLLLAAQSLFPPIPEFVFHPPHTNHPYHVTLGWPPVTNSGGYFLWLSTNGFPEYVFFDTANTRQTISNLYQPTSYLIEIRAQGSPGTNTGSSDPLLFQWPWKKTNFVSVYLGTLPDPVVVDTNPPDLKFYRASIVTGSNSIAATIQGSLDLTKWQSFPGLFILTNKTANRFLRLAVTNNTDFFIRPD